MSYPRSRYWAYGVGATGVAFMTTGIVSYIAIVAGVTLLALDFYTPPPANWWRR